jgi:hypothetical protein
MPTGKPKIGIFYKSAGAAINPPVCIPAKKYAKKYFLSLAQIKKLLANNSICAIKFKRRLFIADIPPLKDG